MARLDMDQVHLKPKEVTTMSVKKSKEEGKKERREQSGACYHHHQHL